MNRLVTDESIDVLCLARGCERYIILAGANQRTEVIRQLARWVSDESLSFSSMDAANMIRKMEMDSDYRMECEGR